MLEQINQLLDSTDRKIVQRGEEYYKSKMIEELVLSPDGNFTAQVFGSEDEPYNILVEKNKSGEVLGFSCSCPYDMGDICKHLVAVFIAIKNGEYKKVKKAKPKAKPEQDIAAVIQSADEDALKMFVHQYANTDTRFKNELLVAFGKPNIEAEMSEIKELVRTAVRRNTYRGYIDYSGCNSMCKDFDEILSLAEKRLHQGHALISFSIALHVLLTSVKLASTADSSSGALTDTIDYALKLIDNCCEALSDYGNEEEQKFAYDKCVKEAQNKVFEGWGEWNYDMLRSCTRFVTHKNVDKLYSALDHLAKSYKSWNSYYIIDDKLTRLQAIHRLEGEEAADNYIEENIEIDQFRTIAVNKALGKRDFATAERLCLERLRREPNEHGVRVRHEEWLQKLFNVHEITGNIEEQINIADQLLMLKNFSYYNILKSLLAVKGTWEQEYPDLIRRCAEALPYNMYMEILKMENEHRLLFEEVKKFPAMVFRYGKLLAQNYQADIYKIFKAQIEKQVNEATDRKKYANVCDSLNILFEAGGIDETVSLIADFRQKYNRRPAMLDELARLERKLAKKK